VCLWLIALKKCVFKDDYLQRSLALYSGTDVANVMKTECR
jgi:hypothetical protein